MLERSGERFLAGTRSAQTAADSTYPSGSGQSGSVEVPQEARGAVTHVTLDVDASSTANAVAHLYGYLTETAEWYHLGGIRNGATLTPTSPSPIAEGTNNLHVAESWDHVTIYDRLFLALTTLSGTGASATTRFFFEGPRKSTT